MPRAAILRRILIGLFLTLVLGLAFWHGGKEKSGTNIAAQTTSSLSPHDACIQQCQSGSPVALNNSLTAAVDPACAAKCPGGVTPNFCSYDTANGGIYPPQAQNFATLAGTCCTASRDTDMCKDALSRCYQPAVTTDQDGRNLQQFCCQYAGPTSVGCAGAPDGAACLQAARSPETTDASVFLYCRSNSTLCRQGCAQEHQPPTDECNALCDSRFSTLSNYCQTDRTASIGSPYSNDYADCCTSGRVNPAPAWCTSSYTLCMKDAYDNYQENFQACAPSSAGITACQQRALDDYSVDKNKCELIKQPCGDIDKVADPEAYQGCCIEHPSSPACPQSPVLVDECAGKTGQEKTDCCKNVRPPFNGGNPSPNWQPPASCPVDVCNRNVPQWWNRDACKAKICLAPDGRSPLQCGQNACMVQVLTDSSVIGYYDKCACGLPDTAAEKSLCCDADPTSQASRTTFPAAIPDPYDPTHTLTPTDAQTMCCRVPYPTGVKPDWCPTTTTITPPEPDPSCTDRCNGNLQICQNKCRQDDPNYPYIACLADCKSTWNTCLTNCKAPAPAPNGGGPGGGPGGGGPGGRIPGGGGGFNGGGVAPPGGVTPSGGSPVGGTGPGAGGSPGGTANSSRPSNGTNPSNPSNPGNPGTAGSSSSPTNPGQPFGPVAPNLPPPPNNPPGGTTGGSAGSAGSSAGCFNYPPGTCPALYQACLANPSCTTPDCALACVLDLVQCNQSQCQTNSSSSANSSRGGSAGSSAGSSSRGSSGSSGSASSVPIFTIPSSSSSSRSSLHSSASSRSSLQSSTSSSRNSSQSSTFSFASSSKSSSLSVSSAFSSSSTFQFSSSAPSGCSSVQCVFANCSGGDVCQVQDNGGFGPCNVQCIHQFVDNNNSSTHTTVTTPPFTDHPVPSSAPPATVNPVPPVFPENPPIETPPAGSPGSNPVPPPPNVSETPACGDGIVQKDLGEQCDNGNICAPGNLASCNRAPGTGGTCTCDPNDPECARPAGTVWSKGCQTGTCGDGIAENAFTVGGVSTDVQGIAEVCDHGAKNGQNGDSCSSTCQFVEAPFCGNGTKNPGEECDDGPRNSNILPDHCRTNCSESRCGDGVIDSGEQCDDGNVTSGDGCSYFCVLEKQTSDTMTAQVIDLAPLPTPAGSMSGTAVTGNVTQIATSHAPAGKEGPGAILAIAAGAAAGFAFVRRRKMKLS